MVNILVVDDEQGMRDLFYFLLEPYGFHITTANDLPTYIHFFSHLIDDI